MKPRFARILSLQLAVVALYSFSPTPAAAAGFITVGSQYAGEGGTTTVSTGSIMRVTLEADRSYACTALGASTGSTLDLSDTVAGPGGTTVTAEKRGDVSPLVTADTSSDDNRLTLTPENTGTHIFQVSQATANEVVRVECLETTLYGGYNTNVNDFNFLEITNITGAEISGTITAKNFDGTVVIDSLPFTVGADNRIDVDIHSAAGPAKFGTLKVTHDGPYGALQAAVSQYSGDVTDFQLSESTPLRSREQSL